jgi:homoserine dehydrogenase
MNIAVLGYGTVGSALARRLADSTIPNLRLTHIFDRRAPLKRDARLGDVVWTTDVEEIFASDAGVVVEVIGGVDPAREWIRTALARGKSVVTANKQALAHGLRDLTTFACRQGRQLRFEAAVGGAMPIVRAISDAMAGDRVTSISAVLNGTTTFVLSHMEETGLSLDAAIDAARTRGYAESDPAADLDGSDASAKLIILCAVAFGIDVTLSAIETRSIRELTARDILSARRSGHVIRQIASAAYDARLRALTAWVAPVELPRDSFLARTRGVENAALVGCQHAGEIGLFGHGAGGDATAVALLSDVLAIARDPAALVPAPVLVRPSIVTGLTARTVVEEAV